MTSPSHAPIRCPSCDKVYQWRAELAGKRITCRACGEKFVVEGGTDDAAERLVADSAKRGGHVVPKRRDEANVVDPDDPTTLHNWVLPGATLLLAVLWRGQEIVAHVSSTDVPLWHSTLLVLLEWLVVSVAVGIALIVTSAFAGLEINSPWSVALKVASVSLLMAAACNFFSGFDRPGDLYGMMFGLPCVLVLGLLLFAGMYRADLSESLMATIAVLFLASAAMMILAGTIKGPPGLILGFGRPVTG